MPKERNVSAMAEKWYVTINDSTPAYDQAEINRHNPGLARDIDEEDLIHIESRTYKTTRGMMNFIERFTMELREYMVLEDVRTNGEHYLRCLGKRNTDSDVRIYEVVAYRQ